jgi:hypothetical protein
LTSSPALSHQEPSTWPRIATAVLYLYFMTASVALGGALYSSVVIEHLWSSDPPASVYQWSPAIERAGNAFWRRVSPLVLLLSLITLATSVRLNRDHVRWRVPAAVFSAASIVWSLLYFVPTASALTQASPGSSEVDVVQAVTTWTQLDTWRMLLVALAWLCGSRALMVPARKRSTAHDSPAA